MRTGSLLDDPAARRRMAERFRRRREPARPPYSPRLRPDQVRALYYLKRFERRAMTKLLQEALDRYLEPDGGAEASSPAASPSSAIAARSSTDAAASPSTNAERRRGQLAAPPNLFANYFFLVFFPPPDRTLSTTAVLSRRSVSRTGTT